MKNWRGAGDAGVRAERLSVRPWTDPRLLLGVLLVLGASVLGARLVAVNDDTVEYWSVSADVQRGDPASAEQLVPVRVRLDDATATRYLRVQDELPGPLADLQWGRDAEGGALLDRSTLVRRTSDAMRQLPVTVAEGAAPPDLSRGDLVELWATHAGDSGDSAAAVRILGSVRVLHTGADANSLGGALAKTVMVEVPATALTGEVIAAVGSERITIVRMP